MAFNPSSQKVPAMQKEFEQMIELGKCEGKLAVLKIVRPDTDPEYTYQIRLEGERYGQFGIVLEDSVYYVVHVASGRVCGEFADCEYEDARRLVFLLRKLTDWRKAGWSDPEKYAKSPLRHVVEEALKYCITGLGGQYDKLMKVVKSVIPKTKEEIVEEFITEAEAVPFGDENFVPVQKSPKSEDDGWGQTIT